VVALVLLVVDASVLVAALLRASRVRKILLRPSLEGASPASVREEILAKLPVFATALHLTQARAREALEEILRPITFHPMSREQTAFLVAMELIGKRDPSDAPVVALAIKLDALGIWSLDKDFDGIPGVPRLTTAGVERLLDLAGAPDER
jgi:predicted nucleic acid-binding protein